MKGQGDRIFRGSNWTRENQDKEREDEECFRMVNSERS